MTIPTARCVRVPGGGDASNGPQAGIDPDEGVDEIANLSSGLGSRECEVRE